jgi:glutathione S-transferase
MYKNTGKTHQKPILWGAPGSAYSGKTRSYFIKKGIAYDEFFPPHPRYQNEIMPLIGYFVMPVVELPDGTLIQDTTDTIVHFEQQLAEPALIPSTPLHKAVAWLLGFFGSELFLQPGLHYRWSYLEEQRSYLEALFAEILSPSQDPEQQRADVAPAFAALTGALPSWGVTAATIPTREASLEASLDILEVHFLHHPYLLGGRPSLADFGLMSLFFAHLARDPYPSAMMKARAPHVYRWTERMNLAGFVDGGFPEVAPDYFPDDQVPDTLVAFLRYLFADHGPEMIGMLASYNAWVDTHPDLPAGTIVHNNPDQPVAHPPLGQYEYELRGVHIQRIEFIDAVYHFQRVLDVTESLESESRSRFDTLVEQTGGSELMGIRPARRLASEYYRFVLA